MGIALAPVTAGASLSLTIGKSNLNNWKIKSRLASGAIGATSTIADVSASKYRSTLEKSSKKEIDKKLKKLESQNEQIMKLLGKIHSLLGKEKSAVTVITHVKDAKGLVTAGKTYVQVAKDIKSMSSVIKW